MEFLTPLRITNPVALGINRINDFVSVAVVSGLIALAGCGPRQTPADPIAEEIRSRTLPTRICSGTDSIFCVDLVRSFYENRSFAPAWTTSDGTGEDSDSLLTVLRGAGRDGLRPEEYHLAAIESAVARIESGKIPKAAFAMASRVDLELLFTDAFLLYASHLSEGRIDGETMTIRLCRGTIRLRYDSLLENAIKSHSITSRLQSLLPAHRMYEDLRGVLASYVTIAERGGWGRIGAGPTIREGDGGGRILALKNRLRISGDYSLRAAARRDRFDSSLVASVRTFQRRHGIDPSGVVDSLTFSALNVTVDRRIDQIILTMERWRWMPHDLGAKHIRINIPDFRLVVTENDRDVLSMKVVLGVPAWQTPVFSASMTQVLFNSPWMAPEDIVEKELINYMKADSSYLPNNKMSLWRRRGDSLIRVDPRSIDWPGMNGRNIDFRLRQEAGPQNIMGQVKFLIPNRFNIYLHDTPYREDFPKTVRMFSHGCIRLEKPLDLAEYILRDAPDWTRAKIDSAVARNSEHSLVLKSPIPVHVFYATVWKSPDGSIQLRDDFYGLDQRLAAAFFQTAIKSKKHVGTAESIVTSSR